MVDTFFAGEMWVVKLRLGNICLSKREVNHGLLSKTMAAVGKQKRPRDWGGGL